MKYKCVTANYENFCDDLLKDIIGLGLPNTAHTFVTKFKAFLKTGVIEV